MSPQPLFCSIRRVKCKATHREEQQIVGERTILFTFFFIPVFCLSWANRPERRNLCYPNR